MCKKEDHLTGQSGAAGSSTLCKTINYIKMVFNYQTLLFKTTHIRGVYFKIPGNRTNDLGDFSTTLYQMIRNQFSTGQNRRSAPIKPDSDSDELCAVSLGDMMR